MKKVIFVFLLLLVIGSSFASASWYDIFFSPETRQVRVLIKDNLGNALSTATVKFKVGTTTAFTQTTDSNGVTPYVSLNVGQYYTAEVSKTGYQTNTFYIGTIVSGTAQTYGPHVLTPTTAPSSPICMDSDFISGQSTNPPTTNDQSIKNKGNTQIGSNTPTPDKCPTYGDSRDTLNVIEQYCDTSTTSKQLLVSCPSGYTCSDGKCIASSTPTTTTPSISTCTDTDNPNNQEITITQKRTPGNAHNSTSTKKDVCIDPEESPLMKEAYCLNNVPTYSASYDCGESYNCRNDPSTGEGYCVSATRCTDSDNNEVGYQPNEQYRPGRVTTPSGNVFRDACIHQSELNESYCSTSTVASSKIIDCGEGNECQSDSNNEGYCTPEGTQGPITTQPPSEELQPETPGRETQDDKGPETPIERATCTDDDLDNSLTILGTCIPVSGEPKVDKCISYPRNKILQYSCKQNGQCFATSSSFCSIGESCLEGVCIKNKEVIIGVKFSNDSLFNKLLRALGLK